MIAVEQGVELLSQGNTWLRFIQDQLKENQFLIAVMGGGVLGTLWLFFKTYASKIINNITKWFVVELRITETSTFYPKFILWFNTEIIHKQSFIRRKFIIDHKHHWGNFNENENPYISNDTILNPGQGNHWFIFNKRICRVHLHIEQATAAVASTNGTGTDNEKQIFRITFFVLSNVILKKFVSYVSNYYDNRLEDNSIVSITRSGNSDILRYKRDINTIYGNKEVITSIKNNVQQFMNSKDWYIKHGIPYKLSILLHGMPGLGRSSTFLALASYFNKPINYVNMKTFSIFNGYFNIIEDIDCQNNNNIRRRNPIQEQDDSELSNPFGPVQPTIYPSLSEILNTMDGLLTQENSIIFISTNHIEHLDPAFFRPGRIDFCYELKPLKGQEINEMIQGLGLPSISNSIITENAKIIPCKLQELVISKIRNPNINLEEEIINNLIH